MFQPDRPMAYLTAAQAVDEAHAYTEATIAMDRSFRETQPALYERIRSLMMDVSGERTPYVMSELRQKLGETTLQNLCVIVATSDAAQRWRRHRVVYRINHDLAEALIESDPTTALPRDVFTRLPHPNPFIAFPAPVEMPADSLHLPLEKPSKMTGMLVTGLDSRGVPCDTSAPDLTRLKIALATKVTYEGQSQTYEELQIQIAVRGPGPERMSIDAMVADQVATSIGSYSAEHAAVGFRLAVGLLLYLCSDQAETRRAVIPKSRASRTARPRSAKTVIDVGFDIGPRLASARRQRDHRASMPGSTSSSPRAHLRRAHWHTFLTGPMTGPRVAIVRWVHPIHVNADAANPERAQLFNL